MIPKPQNTKKFIIKAFLTIAVPVLLTIFSVRLVMSHQFVQFEYQRPDFPLDFYGFTLEDRFDYSPYGIDYLLTGDDISFLADLRLPVEKCWQPPPNATDCPMFEETALKHMEDVKAVTTATFTIAFFMLMITLGLLALPYRVPSYRQAVRLGLTYGSILTLSIIGTLVVIAITAWDYLFDTFHELFFEAGTWRFAFSDTLIRLFPEKFWFDAGLTIGILTTVGALIILGLMWQRSRRAG